jgi:hypothetical protein
MILVTCRENIRSSKSVRVYNKFLEILGTIWQKCQLVRQVLIAENFAGGGIFCPTFLGKRLTMKLI